MKYPFEIVDLPSGYEVCTNYYQLCKLKKNKRLRIPENLTPRIGLIYFVYSEIHEGYYQRKLQPYTPKDLLTHFINRRVLYYNPDYGTES